MKNSVNSKIKNLGGGRFLIDGKYERNFVPVEGEKNTWELERKEIILSPEETMKARSFGYDLKKVLIVKICLTKGMTPTAIKKKENISRNSIYKYKKILSEINKEVQKKDSSLPENTKNVLSIWFIFIGLDGRMTFSVLLILGPIFILGIGASVFRKWGLYKQSMIAHREEASKLHFQFTKVCNLSFKREPILCNSDDEVAHFQKLLRHYNNQGRTVFSIERKKGQTPNQHFNAKELWSKQFSSANRHEIQEGKYNLGRHWSFLEEKGLLDFLYTPKRDNWLQSKAYLYSAIEFFLNNSVPSSGDKARQKYLINLIPQDYESSAHNSDKQPSGIEQQRGREDTSTS